MILYVILILSLSLSLSLSLHPSLSLSLPLCLTLSLTLFHTLSLSPPLSHTLSPLSPPLPLSLPPSPLSLSSLSLSLSLSLSPHFSPSYLTSAWILVSDSFELTGIPVFVTPTRNNICDIMVEKIRLVWRRPFRLWRCWRLKKKKKTSYHCSDFIEQICQITSRWLQRQTNVWGSYRTRFSWGFCWSTLNALLEATVRYSRDVSFLLYSPYAHEDERDDQKCAAKGGTDPRQYVYYCWDVGPQGAWLNLSEGNDTINKCSTIMCDKTHQLARITHILRLNYDACAPY